MKIATLPRLAACALAASLALTGAARADNPGVGFGLSWVFGQHSGKGLAAGVKLFSSREKNEIAGTLGVDYHFATSSFRPTLGAAYMGDRLYGEANFGYSMYDQVIDFGLGGGLVNTKD